MPYALHSTLTVMFNLTDLLTLFVSFSLLTLHADASP